MQIDYEAWRFWLGILQLIGTVAIGIYVWWSNREKVTATRFLALERQVAERLSVSRHEELEEKQAHECKAHREKTSGMEQELRRIDGELRHLPNHSDIGRIHNRIDEINGALREVVGGLKALNNSVALINEHLLNGSKR